jgi:glycerol-3-phosphate dehydrogenase
MGLEKRYDVAIIGAGVVGCSIARELSFFDLSICVIEKSNYMCSGQSKANGAIIHAGHNEKSYKLKAKLNVEGNKLFPEFCNSLGVRFKNTGLCVVAIEENELKILEELKKQGTHNGVQNLEILNADKLFKKEPNISKDSVGGLYVPTAGIVDVHKMVISLAEHAAINGVDFFFGEEVTGFKKENNFLKGIKTENNIYSAKTIINCAGVYSDKVAKLAGDDSITIIPRKGEYYIYDKEKQKAVERPCFPTPNPDGKGVVIFPTINGNIIFGGNSIISENKEDTSTTREGLFEVYAKARKLVPLLELKDIITGFSGVRSSVKGEDFIIKFSENINNLLNVSGIDSPGLSSIPAIVRYVVSLMEDKNLKLKRKEKARQIYSSNPLFKEMDEKNKNDSLKENKLFGRIVCRCEEITEGDIVNAINSPIPAKTLDAIKFKTFAGAGRCQGSFDLERIIKIVARELKISELEVLKGDKNSNIVKSYLKG